MIKIQITETNIFNNELIGSIVGHFIQTNKQDTAFSLNDIKRFVHDVYAIDIEFSCDDTTSAPYMQVDSEESYMKLILNYG